MYRFLSLSVVFLMACGGSPQAPPAPAAPVVAPEAVPATDTEVAHHVHAAPHGGCLIVLGEEFAHIELIVDSAARTVTGYMLDGEAEKPVRIAAKQIEISIPAQNVSVKLDAIANPLTGETIGSTSEFRAAGVTLPDRFDGVITELELLGQVFRKVPFNYPDGNE